MPRPVDSPAPSPLCERIQQFRERMRSRCLAAASGSDATENSAIPCLLQSWRKRIEAMDDEPQQQQQAHRHHRGHRHFGQHHRRPCHAAAESSASERDASSSSSSPSSPPPTCGGFPFRGGPRMLHPRLERQQAVCSLSGIWSGFASSSLSPPPPPEIYAKPRHRRHPYARCFGRTSQDSDADDHRKSSEEE
ncbi:hypothetical protein PHYSODRAFT_531121 [Phytophthora sojae]|uniref:Uncharacterized protein n=1 Tax=Phytophthora sojae (strain P6497) TaxID=1094619 RepID=G5ADU8_PHYSP|nr:hypothetical protein PHYSODRAFT_531121 [Phytophthora sojae]EGZ06350.1 hypothetical protein PHYSODRAFT_531121 [Phytophthora sojae]|eukprot:XP_009538247.1 hypothetical protein PHYSODRAFT_531121 [Phytophthora sojae]